VTAHLLHVFSTFAPGGPQVRTTRLIAALGPGWRHSILAMDGCTTARELLPEGARVELLPALAKAGALRSVRRLRGLLREVGPDLLLTYNWGAIEAVVAARFAGLRAVLHHEDGFLPDEAAGFKRRRVLARRYCLRGVQGVIVPSGTLHELALQLWKLPRERVHWIPNGIELDAFEPADGHPELRARLGIPPAAFVVGYVGHLRREKNPARLIHALARLQDEAVHALVLGAGPEEAAVEQAIRDHELAARVHLVGHQERPAEYYRAMNAFALSSDTEQMPVALLEAMASGLPAVSTDVGDVRRMLPASSRAFVVPLAAEEDETTADLARVLAELAADPERARRLGLENRAHVQASYAFERMLAAYRERYEAALGRAPGADPGTPAR